MVAAFDLDGTLTEGGSVFAWLRAVAGARPTYGAALALAAPLAVGAVRSGPAADDAKERLFTRLLAGRDLAAVAATSRAFALEHLARHGRRDVLARLEWHRQRGDDVVIVSASPQVYVEVIAQRLGADAAIATRLAVDGTGRLTGRYEGGNCRGEEKRRRVSEWAWSRGDGDVEAYAYGNSRGDRRLLDWATHPYDVGRLGRVGALRAFPRLAGEASQA